MSIPFFSRKIDLLQFQSAFKKFFSFFVFLLFFQKVPKIIHGLSVVGIESGMKKSKFQLSIFSNFPFFFKF